MELYDVHRGWITIDESIPRDFICDIDGTVADVTHRRHYVQSKPKNWAAFEKLAHLDPPIERVIKMVQLLQGKGWTLLMCSGRGEQQRGITEKWLKENGLHPVKLYMRKEGDYRQDSIVKKELLDQIKEDGYHPVLSLDDRDQVVEMWRKNGIPCVQVAEGNF